VGDVGRLNGAEPVKRPRIQIQVRRDVAQNGPIQLIVDLCADHVRLVVIPFGGRGAERPGISSGARVVPDIPIEKAALAVGAGRGIRALVDQILGMPVLFGALRPQVYRQPVGGVDDGRQAQAQIVLRVRARHLEAVVIGVIHGAAHGHIVRELEVLRGRDMDGRVIADLQGRFAVVIETRFRRREVDGAADGAAAVQGALRSRQHLELLHVEECGAGGFTRQIDAGEVEGHIGLDIGKVQVGAHAADEDLSIVAFGLEAHRGHYHLRLAQIRDARVDQYV
jgi:hypothetical protein